MAKPGSTGHSQSKELPILGETLIFLNPSDVMAAKRVVLADDQRLGRATPPGEQKNHSKMLPQERTRPPQFSAICKDCSFCSILFRQALGFLDQKFLNLNMTCIATRMRPSTRPKINHQNKLITGCG